MTRSPLKRRSARPKKVPVKARMAKAFQKAGIAIGPGSADKEEPYRVGLGRNEARSKEQHQKAFDGGGLDHDTFIRSQPCCLCAVRPIEIGGRVESAHTVKRSQQGRWWNQVPLCAAHHREQEEIGNERVLELYGVDLKAKAHEYARRHLDQVLRDEASEVN